MKKPHYLKYVLHVAVVVGLVVAAVKYVDGDDISRVAQTFSFVFIGAMGLLVVTYFLLKALRFTFVIAPFNRHLPAKVILKAYVSGQAATLVPGGIAARAGLLHQVGMPVAESSVPIAMHSFWDFTMFLLGGTIAALWFEAVRLPVFILWGVVGVITLLMLFPRPRAWLAKQGEFAAARFKITPHWQRFWAAIPHVFTAKLILICLALTFLAFTMEIMVLNLSLQGFGVALSYPHLILTFIFPTLVGKLVPVMDGVGVTEVGMVGFLTGIGQVDGEVAVLAVAVFRIITIVFPVVLGALVYFFSWRGEVETAAANRPKEN